MDDDLESQAFAEGLMLAAIEEPVIRREFTAAQIREVASEIEEHWLVDGLQPPAIVRGYLMGLRVISAAVIDELEELVGLEVAQ